LGSPFDINILSGFCREDHSSVKNARKLIQSEIGKTRRSYAIYAGQTAGTFLGVRPTMKEGALQRAVATESKS
jgi:hypothetical protein